MAYICEPERLKSGSWAVELIGYPESRTTETYSFDTKAEAVAFYEKNKDYGKQQPMKDSD